MTLDVGRFDPNLRDEMVAFFGRALSRNAEERFDNAEQMLQDCVVCSGRPNRGRP